MDLSRVIIGPVVTEKAERAKSERKTYTLRVAPQANKIDVKNALQRFYEVSVTSVRSLKVRPKTRLVGAGTAMEKRHAFKKMIVTLAKDSKALDLASFKTES